MTPSRGRFSVTPALGTRVPSLRPPPNLDPPWVQRARALVLALQEAIDGKGDASDVARVERTCAAWELGGTQAKVSARVAYLVERAYHGLHETRRAPSEQALQGCAHVLYNGLPSAVRNQTDFARVLLLMRWLATETEAWPAIVRASSELLGWNQIALTHGGHALRVAMATRIERIG